MMYKKAASLWIAWVLLLSIVVLSGAVIGKWWTHNAKNYVSSMNEKFNTQQCNYLYFRINSICQNLDSVNLVVTNPSSMDITGLKVSTFDIYGNIKNNVLMNQILRSTYSDPISFLKDNVITNIEITPFFDKSSNSGITRTYCENRKVVIDKIPFCDEKR